MASSWPTRLFVLLILAGTATVLRPVIAPDRNRQKQRQITVLLEARSFNKARALAEELLETDPMSDFNNLLMAECLASQRETDEAKEYYDRVSASDPQLHLVASFGKAQAAYATGHIREAERLYRQTLDLDEQHIESLRRLAFLLRVEGRIWESTVPVRKLIQQAAFRCEHISMMGSRAIILDKPLFVNNCLKSAPSDPLPRLGEAVLHRLRNRDQQAEPLLREIIRSSPEMQTAQAGLGGLLTDQQRDTEFLSWHRSLSPEADEHPQIWYVRGQFLSRNKRHAEAARCFLEVLKRAPNHVEATYMLSQALQTCRKSKLALLAAQRSEELARVETTINTVANGLDLEAMEKVAGQLADLHRHWEAAGICYLVVEGTVDRKPWAEVGLCKNLARLHYDTTFEPGIIPVNGLRVDDFPLPDWSKMKAGETLEPTSASPSEISFVENANDVGLNFQYYNGSQKPKGLEHIFETTGGGVAVLDFDADRWPDLWMAQGNSVWSKEASTEFSDSIFRNIDGFRFQNVTSKTTVNESGFSQGVATGDINSDGFVDVYVGNVGPNQLLINNGDGTFTDATEETGVGGDEWTMSPAIVDLNQDGFPEIYSLSYLNRDEVLKKRCRKNGKPLTCAPTMFTAEQDRLYQNLGDGRMDEVTQSCGIIQDAGNGLGLVAADFDSSGRISLFIGNDTTNNFFFRNETPPGGPLKFSEQALLLGLACDGLGKAQATMGIAADDCNGDGNLDLFITNFYGDPNTLFQSESAGSWSDQTRAAKLFSSSVDQLGFGCQFLDADLDGWPDLVITNGHVDRSDATNEPDEMRPQFYRNQAGRFKELPADTVGEFFAGEYLGRALSTLDWNRDGMTDCCISHLFTPAALLTNKSKLTGNVLRVRLIGVAVDRDAVGTRVTVEAGGKSWTKQLTLGNGYESTNERILTFGLNEIELTQTMKVHWISGNTTVLNDLPVNSELTIIEGKNAVIIDTIER